MISRLISREAATLTPSWISDEEYKAYILLKTLMYRTSVKDVSLKLAYKELGYPQLDPKYRDKESGAKCMTHDLVICDPALGMTSPIIDLGPESLPSIFCGCISLLRWQKQQLQLDRRSSAMLSHR